MRTLNECLACGAKETTEVYDATFSGSPDEAAQYFLKFRDKVARGRVVRCKKCRFMFTNPQFTPEEYNQIYAAAAQATSAEDPLKEAEVLRFERLSKLVKRCAGAPHRLLDLGCGDGQFLKQVEAKEKVGYEVGAPGLSTEDGITIISGDFLTDVNQLPSDETNVAKSQTASPLNAEAFDVITAWDVFEHLPDLDSHVTALARLLKINGLIFVTIPDPDSIIARVTGSRWNMLLLEHLWYFNRNNFEIFMNRHGFTKVEDGPIPFSVSVSHLAKRFSQTYGVDMTALLKPLNKLVVSMRIGLIYAVYRRT